MFGPHRIQIFCPMSTTLADQILRYTDTAASATWDLVYVSTDDRDDRKEFWGNRGSSCRCGTLRPQTFSGFTIVKNKTNRFVVLHHKTTPQMDRCTHWDLMLETEEGLLTWALESEPSLSKEGAILCEQLPLHRKHYLDYEGEISDNRGTVSRWDQGAFEWRTQADGLVEIELHGAKLRGVAKLTRIDEEWFFLIVDRDQAESAKSSS